MNNKDEINIIIHILMELLIITEKLFGTVIKLTIFRKEQL